MSSILPNYHTQFLNELTKRGIKEIREINLDQTYAPREPTIDNHKRAKLLEKKDKGKFFDRQKYNGQKLANIQYCNRCLYSRVQRRCSLTKQPLHGV